MVPKTQITQNIVVAIIMLSAFISNAFAAATTPATINYQGRLLDNVNAPLTGSYDFRFSLWSDGDFTSGVDVDGTGAINTGASGYAGWQEVQTVATDSFGLFNAEIGSSTTLPTFDATSHSHIQIEVKPNGNPDTDYEVLDPDGVDNTNDRKKIQNNPFAQNSDRIDGADLGTAAGEIATLGIGGIWDIMFIPGGTNADTFVIDANGTAATEVTLQFGSALGAFLKYSVTNSWFEFGSDVNFAGNQLLNAALENSTTNPTGPATGQVYFNTTSNKAFVYDGGTWVDMTDSGGGSSVWSLNGADAYYTTGNVGIGTNTPTTTLHVDSSAANNVAIGTFENTAGQFQVFRTDATPEGSITANIGDIAVDTTNGNAYIKNSAPSPTTGWVQFAGTSGMQINYNAEYPNVVYEGDGTNNKGVLEGLSEDSGGTNKYNFYKWATTQSTLQDIDLILSFKLPDNFVAFDTTPINLLYKTYDATLGDNQIDVMLYDTIGTAVALTGGADLANGSWTTANITFGGTPTFTAGGVVTMKIKLHARMAGPTNKYSQVSNLTFNYIGTN